MRADELKRQVSNALCGPISVVPVASGFAISSAFEDSSGDRLSFYLTETADGFVIEDDGSYLAQLIARDIPIDKGSRGDLLDGILQNAGAYWDRETYEIRSSAFPVAEMARHVVGFISSLIRVRDLELLTRDVVRSTFRDDAIASIRFAFDNLALIEEDAPISPDFSEFPADLVIRPRSHVRGGKSGAIYFVSTDAKLNEALLLKMEADRQEQSGFGIIALIEDPTMKLISRRKFQRSQNRSLSMPIYRGDEAEAMKRIGRELNLN